MINWGTVPAGSVLPFHFASYDGDTGASEAISGLAVTDIEVYKGTTVTQRSSDAGYALIDTDGIDIDTMVGANGFSIDTGDNTDSGFYSVGSFFTVWVSSVTADGQTVNFIAGTFRLCVAEGTAGTPVVDVGRISNDATAADNAESFFDGTGYAGTNNVIPTVTTLTGHTAQTGDSYARIGATGSGLTSLASQASVNTIDDFLDTEIAAILAAVDTEVAAILADTNELQTDWADGGRLDLILDARASQASVNTIDDFLDTEIAAILEDTGTTLDDFLDTEIAAILADTNELQTDWANGGRLDLLIDAIKAKTDPLTFTVANELNANTRYVAGTQLQGTGTTGDEWGPV